MRYDLRLFRLTGPRLARGGVFSKPRLAKIQGGRYRKPVWQAFFIGVLVGIICVGGLALGVRWLFRSRDESLPESQQTKLGVMGALMIVGQFVVAGLILYYAPDLDKHPLPLAIGLLSMNLILPLFAGKLWKK